MLRRFGLGEVGTVAIIAVGVALSAATFAVLHAVLLEPLPFPEPERIVYLSGGHRAGENASQVSTVSIFVARELDARTDAFERWSAIDVWTPVLDTAGGPVALDGASVNSGFFDILGVTPQLGRFFVPAEDEAGHENVVVIRDAAWRTHFGADPGVVGRAVALNGVPYVVVGVMPAGWEDPRPMNLPAPAHVFRVTPGYFAHHPPSAYSVTAIARLADGVTRERADGDLATAFDAVRTDFPGEFDDRGVPNVVPLLTAITGASARALPLTFAAALLVLLIGAFNVANLTLVRVLDRAGETSVRRALGASHARIAGDLLREQATLAVAGGALGAAAGWALLEFARARQLFDLPRVDALALPFEAVLVATGAALAIALATGLLALRAALGAAPQDALGGTPRAAGAGVGTQRLRRGLVVGEVAVATVLVVAAAVLGGSVRALENVDLGLAPQGVLAAGVPVSYADYPSATTDGAALNRFWSTALAEVGALPGVTAAGAITIAPLGGGSSCESFRRAEDAPPAPGEAGPPCIEARVVAGDYFGALGIPLLAGRAFDPTLDAAGRPDAVLLSRTAAERHWPGENVIGRQLEIWGGLRTVVGLVGDVRDAGPASAPRAIVYFTDAQQPQRSMTLYARTTGDPAALARRVEDAVHAHSPGTPLVDARTLAADVAGALRAPRAAATLVGLFSLAGLLLALSGIAAVFVYLVTCRRAEFGVRLALGSTGTRLTRLVLREAVWLVALGGASGAALSFAATRALGGVVHGVDAQDPAFLAAGLAVIAAGAVAAAWVPAARAARIAPADALRR